MKIYSWNRSLVVVSTAMAALSLFGCGSSSRTEDTSASGAAAAAVGGAMADSNANGTQAMLELRSAPSGWKRFALIAEAQAATACATLKSATGCTAVNSTSVDLAYSACSFGSSTATWTGTLEVSVTGGANTIACGSFPFDATSTGTIQRQFVNALHAPSTATRTSASGRVVTVDHAAANLANYEGDTIAPNIGTGYGAVVTFTSGKRTAVEVKQRVSSTLFDHSVNGSLTISETAGAATRTVSGTVDVYHNKLKVKGTTTFTNVVYSNSCCTPTSGTISTAFAATSQSGTLGTALQGKTETMVFTACGEATLKDAAGASIAVNVSQCF